MSLLLIQMSKVILNAYIYNKEYKIIQILLISSFLFGSNCFVLSQNLMPQIEFIKSYGGNGVEGSGGAGGGFHFTQDGFILYAGGSNSNTHDLTCNNPTSNKAWLLKTDKQGNKIFSNCFGGSLQIDSVTSSDEYFIDMAATKDSGCIATCYTNSANILPSSNFPYACRDSENGYKVLSLVKYDKAGNVIWTHCYGGGQDDGIYSIANTFDGGYIFLAQVRSTGGDVGLHYGSIFSPDCWLVKVDSIGNIQWKKILGGTGDDYANKVKEICPGQYMTSITTSSTDSNLANLSHYSVNDQWFCVFDSAGNIIKQATVPWYGQYIAAFDFVNTFDGGIIWSGKTFGNNSSNNVCSASNSGDFAVFKMDSLLQMQWCNIEYGSGGQLNSITALSDSVFLTCGNSESTTYNQSNCFLDTNQNWQGWMICLDINGNILWKKIICGSHETEANYSIFDTSTGSIYVSGGGQAIDGNLTGVPNYGEADEWLFKIDLVTGINNINITSSINIYPNPVCDYLYVQIPPLENGKIELMNIDGGKIFSKITHSNELVIINTQQLSQGLYLLSYYDSNFCLSKKITKE
jgi:hypothetical protein